MSKEWRYCLSDTFSAEVLELQGVSFSNEWFSVESGRITIKQGYAWNGASPARRLTKGIWLGPWDGPLMEDGRPASWVATLVHDALCSAKHDIRVGKKATVKLFQRQLKERGAPQWMVWLYPKAVYLFGPKFSDAK